MTPSESDWADQVQQAVIAGDPDALRVLYQEALALFGDDASVRWADAVSGLDATAQTG